MAAYVKKLDPPYFFGFSVLTATFMSAVQVSKELKELYPDSVICFGGVHLTAVHEEVMAFDHIDLVIRGEAETIMPKLFRCVKARRDYTHLPSLLYRDAGKIVHNDRAPIIADLDSLPVFPYHRFTSQRYDLGIVVSSRGCPHRCIFCSNRITMGKRYRY